MNFQNDGCQVIKKLFSDEVCSFFTAYALISELQNPEKIVFDGQVNNAYALYADPFAESLLINCHKKISKYLNMELIPTYSYYRVYRPGSELPPHTDRPACEISVSVCLGYDYLDEDINYPLYAKNNEFILNPGDALIYRGIDITHYRKIFKASKYSYHVQAFLHYVDANGPHSEEQYDSRLFLGYPKNIKKTYPYELSIKRLVDKMIK